MLLTDSDQRLTHMQSALLCPAQSVLDKIGHMLLSGRYAYATSWFSYMKTHGNLACMLDNISLNISYSIALQQQPAEKQQSLPVWCQQ